MPQPPTLPTPQAFLQSLLNNLPTSNPATTSTPLPPTSKTPLLTLHAFFPTLLLPALDLLDRRLLTRFVPQNPPNAECTTTTITTANPDPDPQSVDGNKSERRRIIYYALSTTTTTSHSRHSRRSHAAADPTTSYEIRPHAWSCTCPAFAFAAYNNPPSPSSPITYGEAWEDDYGSRGKVADSGNTNHEEEEDDDDAMMLDVPTEEAVRDDVIGTSGDEQGHGHEWWGGLMRVEGGGGEEVPLCKHLLACVLAERWGMVRGMVEERDVGREEIAGWAAGWGG